MSRQSLVSRWDRAHTRPADDGVAMLLVLMVMMIVGSLSILMLGVIVSQVKPTQFANKESATLVSAEAGIDATLGQLRNALTIDTSQSPAVVIGDQSQLPCASSGSVTSEKGGLAYSVSVRYYMSDPTGQNEAWRAANKLTCTPGSGTTNIAGVSTVPLFAYVRSAGTGTGIPNASATAGDRTIETVYDFSVTDANIKGGLIRLGRANPEMCMAASARAVGATLVTRACDESSSLQKWAYQTDLTLRLAVTINGAQELCIDSPSQTGFAYTVKEQMLVKACDTSFAGQARQRWAFNDNGHLEGPDMNTQNGNGWCIITDPTTSVVGNVNLWQAHTTSGPSPAPNWTGCGDINSSNGTWNLSSSVGAGAAGSQDGRLPRNNGQLVNYAKFGRCFDVTAQDMNHAFLIGYPCKQAINGSLVTWNQRLIYDDPSGHMSTTTLGGDERCVSTPTSPVSGNYVTMVACNPLNIESQRWMFMGASTGDRAKDYTIRSGALGSEMCLSLAETNEKTGTSDNLGLWGSITIETCDGSNKQKWNAPPFPKASKQHDTAERKD